MRRLMLATAALMALALAAPLAGAQYPATNDPPYTQTAPTPPPVDSPSTVEEDALQPNSTSQAETVQAPTTDTMAQTDTTMDATTDTTTTADAAAPATTTDQYAAQTDSTTGDTSMDTMMSPASLQEAAIEAGMDGVPMSAAEVCAPRAVTLGRLTHEKRKQLRFAADRASVCEINRVVINAPGGRGDAVRQVLLEHGFDEADIEVQEASDLGVEMTFAGVATSSEQYAAMYNPQQLASYQPPATSAAPSSTDNSTGAPTATAPEGSMSATPESTTTTTEPMEHGADHPDAATTEEDATL